MNNPNRPAFPTSYNGHEKPSNGITMRQHYAGLAMQGLLANPAIVDCFNEGTYEYVQKAAFAMADAMLNGVAVSAPVKAEAVLPDNYWAGKELSKPFSAHLKPNSICPNGNCDGRMVELRNDLDNLHQLKCNMCKCWCEYRP